MGMFRSVALCAALALAGSSVGAHPNAFCAISAHAEIRAADDVLVLSRARSAGEGLNSITIYDVSDGSLQGKYMYPPDIYYDDEELFWWMVPEALNGTLVVDTGVTAATASIAAFNSTWVITYIKNGGILSKAYTLSTLQNTIQPVTVVSNWVPQLSHLAAGSSGFFLAAVDSTNALRLYQSENGASWSSTVIVLGDTVIAGPLAGAVDTQGNYLLVYHDDDYTFASSLLEPSGESHVAAKPSVVGYNVAITNNGSEIFMVVANDDGNITACLTSDAGSTWGGVVPVEVGKSLSNIGVVKTTRHWLVAFVASNNADVVIRGAATTIPLAGDFATRSVQFRGNATTSYSFEDPSFQGSGGNGYLLAATDTKTNDMTFRPCYNTPVAAEVETTSAPTSTGSANAMAFSGVVTFVVATLTMAMF